MSKFRKFALAVIALSAIAGTTIAANPGDSTDNGIEVLSNGIEVLNPGAFVSTTTINAPAGVFMFAVMNDGEADHIVDMQPIDAAGNSRVYFPILTPGSKLVVGTLGASGIEVLTFAWIEDVLGWN